MKISHEEFITILNEKDKYDKMKDNLRSENEKYEIMRLSRVFYAIKKLFFFLCMYEMYLISAEGYINAGVHSLRVQKTGEMWPSKKDIGSGMGVKNISDLVLKEMHSVLETKNHTREQIKKMQND